MREIFIIDEMNNVVDTLANMAEARRLYVGHSEYSFIIPSGDEDWVPLPWTYTDGLPPEKAEMLTAWGTF